MIEMLEIILANPWPAVLFVIGVAVLLWTKGE